MSTDSDMNMESGMNMDMGAGGDTDAAIAPVHALNHTMFKLDFARNPVEQTAQFVSGPNIPFGNITSCAEEACSHVAAFSVPPSAHGLLTHGLCFATLSLSPGLDLLKDFVLAEESDTSPPRLLQPDRIVTLRI